MKTVGLLMAALLLLSACGNEETPLPGIEVGCGWFEEENCYRESLDPLSACLPDPDETAIG